VVAGESHVLVRRRWRPRTCSEQRDSKKLRKHILALVCSYKCRIANG
jgi:hypothetical protein